MAKMAIWYLTWGVLAYVMTLGKSNRQARDWVFTGQIVMLAAEVAIVTTPGGVLPSWLFPHMAEYEVRRSAAVYVVSFFLVRSLFLFFRTVLFFHLPFSFSLFRGVSCLA